MQAAKLLFLASSRIFIFLFCIRSRDPGIFLIRDKGWKKFKSGIRVKHPKAQHWIFRYLVHVLCVRLGRGHREERAAVRGPEAGGPGRRGQDPSHDPRRDHLGGQGQYSHQSSPLLTKSGSRFKQCCGSGSFRRIRMFLSLLDPDPDPLVRGTDPDPDPSIFKQ